ncbi:MAG: TSUP family transporter, partial [Lachnospiraceae bacterium]|nr:TSUP family transporter [Lachnospiraceae bacterium]
GTGTFLLLGFTLILGLDVKIASGNVKLCNLTSNIAALITFLIHGQVLILLGAVAAVFSIAGHYTGSSLVMKNGIRIVRPIMLIVISILYIKICYEAFF